MKYGLLFTLIVAAGVAEGAARQGVDGGGGVAVVCARPGGAPASVELLDLYEARAFPRMVLMRATGNLLEDYTRLTNNSLRLQGPGPLGPVDHAGKLRHMLSLIDWHVGSTPLPFLNDHGGTIALPANCRLQQVAIFYDSKERFTVDQTLWKLMDSLNQAALLKHESYYYFERTLGEPTSETTRSYVRQEAAMRGLTPVYEGISPGTTRCYAYNGRGKDPFIFHVTNQRVGTSSGVVFQFRHLGGRHLLVKTIAAFPGFNLDVVSRNDAQGQPYLVPASPTANQLLRARIQTDHIGDWELQMSYVANRPITLALMHRGRALSVSVLRICGPDPVQ